MTLNSKILKINKKKLLFFCIIIWCNMHLLEVDVVKYANMYVFMEYA